jgi:RNA polymerase sigma-70 factor (ECF subfamily)
LDELLERFGREIQEVAYLILRDRGDAEDVMCETLLAALDRAGSLRDPAALRPWLLRIAARRAVDARRRRLRLVSLSMGHDRPMPSVDEAQHLAVMAALDDLSPRARAAVVLHYYSDLPVADVANALGTSPNTVKTQLRRALDRMRVALADEPAPTVSEVARG